MISLIIIYPVVLILNLLWLLLGGVGILMPQQATDAFVSFISHIGMLSGVFPVATLIAASLAVIVSYGVKYLVKLILWLLSFVPFINHPELPRIGEGGNNTLNLRPRYKGHTVDLKNPNTGKGRIVRKTQDIFRLKKK